MVSILQSLKVLGDPVRIRILLILQTEEVSVAELQEILSMGQSRISTHLALLKRAGLVEDRRLGKNSLYRATDIPNSISQTLAEADIAEITQDQRALQLVLGKRADKTRAYFDELAGKFGRSYVPGRSWRGLAEMLLCLLPPLEIADLGAGEGGISQLLARNAKRVIAIDNSPKMAEVGRELAQKNGITNLEYRVGDIEAPPIDAESVDLAFFSQSLHHTQHPERAVASARQILRPGGRIVILDLKRHAFDQARELYADVWLGFAEVDLDGFLRAAGFSEIQVSTVHREEETPHFETVLAIGRRPSLLELTTHASRASLTF
jgi:ubiquinone/menaquinone biosynthesis C-methylase UbiE